MLREMAVKTKMFDFEFIITSYVFNFKVFKNIYLNEFVATITCLPKSNTYT